MWSNHKWACKPQEQTRPDPETLSERCKLLVPLHNHITNPVKIQLPHMARTLALQHQLLCYTNHSYWLIWQSIAHGEVGGKSLKSAVLKWLRGEREIIDQKEPLSSEHWEKPQAPCSQAQDYQPSPPSATTPDETACADCFCCFTGDVCGYTHLGLCYENHTKSIKRKKDRSDTTTSRLGILVTETRRQCCN